MFCPQNTLLQMCHVRWKEQWNYIPSVINPLSAAFVVFTYIVKHHLFELHCIYVSYKTLFTRHGMCCSGFRYCINWRCFRFQNHSKMFSMCEHSLIMYTRDCFQADGWTDIQKRLAVNYRGSQWFTVVFIFLGHFIFTNLFIGIIIMVKSWWNSVSYGVLCFSLTASEILKMNSSNFDLWNSSCDFESSETPSKIKFLSCLFFKRTYMKRRKDSCRHNDLKENLSSRWVFDNSFQRSGGTNQENTVIQFILHIERR